MSCRTPRAIRRGCGPRRPTSRCRVCSPGTSISWPTTRNSCSMGTGGWPRRRPGSAADMNGRFPEHLVSVVSDRAEISELSASLVNTARQDWMTLENLATEMPLTEDFAQPPLPVVSRAGPVPVDLQRRRSGRPGRLADHPGLCRGGGTGPAAAGCPDEDEAGRPHHRTAPPDPDRHRGCAADPCAGDHQRAAGVLRAALGPGHPHHVRAAGDSRRTGCRLPSRRCWK